MTAGAPARSARFAELDSVVGRTLAGTATLTVVLVAACLCGLLAFNTTLVTTFLINVVAVVGLGVFVGNSGILSFGHAGFMGLAAYASGIFTMDTVSRDLILPNFPSALSGISLPFGVGVVGALALVALFALGCGTAVARLPPDPAAISTLGVLVIVDVTLLSTDQVTGGAQPLYGVALKVNWRLALAAAVLAVVIARLYRESRAGLQLRASRDDELAAQALGVNVRGLRLQSWVLSAVLAGAAGILLGHFLGAFAPNQFYLTTTVTIVAMLIVGGANTVSGAVMGALLVTAVTETLSLVEDGATIGPLKLPELFGLPTLGLAVALIATMRFRKQGLFGDEELELWLARRLGRPSDEAGRGDVERGDVSPRALAGTGGEH